MNERTPDRVAVLPGIGIGVDVTEAADKLFRLLEIETGKYPIGHDSIVEYGEALTDEVLAACETSDAVLLGAVGTPPEEAKRLSQEGHGGQPTAEQGLLRLRRELECFANLRPVEDYVPPSEDRDRVDLMLVRELLGGEYRGDGHGYLSELRASDVTEYFKWEIERIAHAAFRIAKARAQAAGRAPRVASVDKSNILNTGRMWRKVVTETGTEHPDVELSHYLVDNMAMHLASHPERFDVILCSNLQGDILSDESAGRIHGSLGLAPSASLGERGRKGSDIFEPVHGAAFDIAGEGKANPLATFLSVELMLRYGLDRPEDADDLRTAIDDVLRDGYRTTDMVPAGQEPGYRVVSTNEMADVVSDALAARLANRQSTSAD